MAVWLTEHGEYLLLAVFIASFAFLLIRQKLINSAPEYVGRATVISRRMGTARYHGKYSSGWNYLVTFQVGNDIIELYVTEMEYQSLTEGTTGTLRWQNENLCHFEPEP